MKKTELKNIIKECVREILFDEGVLSNLVAEVAFGITKAQSQLLEEEKTNLIRDKESSEKIHSEKVKARSNKLLETKKKMLNAIGSKKLSGVFEGTEPLRSSPQQAPGHTPLAGQDPTDAGVDISGLFGIAGQRWQQLK
jgi:hypothetical protein